MFVEQPNTMSSPDVAEAVPMLPLSVESFMLAFMGTLGFLTGSVV